MNGFLNILKPPGMTSGGVVGISKRLTRERVGHAGTLDPEACGVLPIMVGRATRLLDYFSQKQKEYIAHIAFGASTDTQDAHGAVIDTSDLFPTQEQVKGVLAQFTGEIMQCPPAYSALKRDGIPLYQLARQGELVQTEPRKTQIDAITYRGQVATDAHMLQVLCGKGTYIRTLCHDIGHALDCPAHMRFLLRTLSGPFSIDNACTLEQMAQAAEEGTLEKLLLPLDYPLAHYRRVDLPKELHEKALNGVKLDPSYFDVPLGEMVRMYIDGEFIGIAKMLEEHMRFQVLVTSAKEFHAR